MMVDCRNGCAIILIVDERNLAMLRKKDLKKEEINDLFRRLNIPREAFPDYSDPETFSKNIKKCSLLKLDKVTYSIGTGLAENKDA